MIKNTKSKKLKEGKTSKNNEAALHKKKQDYFFKEASRILAKRANLQNARAYISLIKNKEYMRKITYKQKDKASITIFVSRKCLTTSTKVIVALVEAANKKIEVKDLNFGKITIGNIKHSITKSKFNDKPINKRRKITKKSSAKKPINKFNKHKPNILKKRRKPVLSLEENRKLAREMMGGRKYDRKRR